MLIRQLDGARSRTAEQARQLRRSVTRPKISGGLGEFVPNPDDMTTVALGGYANPKPLPNRVVPWRATPRPDRIERLRRPGRAERLCDRAGRKSLPTRLPSSQVVVCARDDVES